MKQLKKTFFEKPTLEVAKQLLGKYILCNGILAKITETEAYLKDDPASHSYCGETKRNSPMFQSPATSYVYFTYGMYYCFNITTNKKGIGEAVLIRAVQPIKGIEKIKENRKITNEKQLCNGPAKLTIALNISKKHNNLNLLDKKSPIKILESEKKEKIEVIKTTRIGISKAKEKPHRFYIKNNSFISKK